MLTTTSLWSKTFLLVGVTLGLLGLQGALAQRGQGRYPQSDEESERSQQSPPRQVRAQENEPLVHGYSVGAGLAIYQGDYSLNPNHNPVKYIAGNGQLAIRAGLDHRLGQFNQYGLGADLVYNYLSGESYGNGFKAHALFLDFYADYELPYIKEGLFRVFIGGGPNLIISPSYSGAGPKVSKPENYQRLGTRVIGSLKIGVTILDVFRIGTRISSSDLLDGFKGFVGGIPDFVSFLNFSYRFKTK